MVKELKGTEPSVSRPRRVGRGISIIYMPPKDKESSASRKKRKSTCSDGGQKTRRTAANPFEKAKPTDEEFYVENVLARRLVKGGGVEFLIKWLNYGDSHNTWEPLSNLAGSENMVAEFNERDREERQRDEELQKEQRAIKKAEKAQQDADAAAKQVRRDAVSSEEESSEDSDAESERTHTKKVSLHCPRTHAPCQAPADLPCLFLTQVWKSRSFFWTTRAAQREERDGETYMRCLAGGHDKCKSIIKLSGTSTTAVNLHFQNCHPELHARISVFTQI